MSAGLPGGGPAYCPGPDPRTDCKHGRMKYPQKGAPYPGPAPLGITQEQAYELERNTGRPVRCWRCSPHSEGRLP